MVPKDSPKILLNTSKMKVMVVDFHGPVQASLPILTEANDVELVSAYKYLRVHVDGRLDCSTNTLYTGKRLYFLKRLKSFNICKSVQHVLSNFLCCCYGETVFHSRKWNNLRL